MTRSPKGLKRDKDKYLDLYPGVDPKEIRETFRYDDVNGTLLRHTKKHGYRPVATSLPDRKGYTVWCNKVIIRAHDIVWLLCHGSWPKEPIVASDGNYCNLFIDNLIPQSATIDRLGNFLVRAEGKYFGVKVWHHPYFYKGTRKKLKKDAIRWANEQLDIYNKYGVITEAAAENSSEDVKETGHVGVYYYTQKGLYNVKIKVGDKWMQHGYERNIEDAVESQEKAQKESDMIWKKDE